MNDVVPMGATLDHRMNPPTSAGPDRGGEAPSEAHGARHPAARTTAAPVRRIDLVRADR